MKICKRLSLNQNESQTNSQPIRSLEFGNKENDFRLMNLGMDFWSILWLIKVTLFINDNANGRFRKIISEITGNEDDLVDIENHSHTRPNHYSRSRKGKNFSEFNPLHNSSILWWVTTEKLSVTHQLKIFTFILKNILEKLLKNTVWITEPTTSNDLKIFLDQKYLLYFDKWHG